MVDLTSDKIVTNPLAKLMDKIGITGIASGIFTMIIGIFLIVYEDLKWDDIRLIIGFYFLIVGLINIIGYIFSVWSQHRIANTYIEMETLNTRDAIDEDEQK